MKTNREKEGEKKYMGMTIKHLYERAKEYGYEDYEICLGYYVDGELQAVNPVYTIEDIRDKYQDIIIQATNDKTENYIGLTDFMEES